MNSRNRLFFVGILLWIVFILKMTGSRQRQSLYEISSFYHCFMLMQKNWLHILFPKFVKKSKKLLVQLWLEYIISGSDILKAIEQKTALSSLLWVIEHRDKSFYARNLRHVYNFQANVTILIIGMRDEVVGTPISFSLRAGQNFSLLGKYHYEAVLSVKLIHPPALRQQLHSLLQSPYCI